MIGMLFWSILIPLLIVAAAYALYVWMQVRGLSGILLFIIGLTLLLNGITAIQLRSCLQYLDDGILFIFACNTVIPLRWLVWLQYPADLVKAICFLLLVDAYLARYNHHRAWTTVAYEWFIRLQSTDTRDRPRGNGGTP